MKITILEYKLELTPWGRTSTAKWMRTVVLDNGAHTIKAADFANGQLVRSPEVYSNSVTRSKQDKRNYIADEIDECLDFGNLIFRRPFESGILNNWDIEKVVWDRVYGSKGRGMSIKPRETSIVVTEPVMNLPNVQEHYDQMLFEEYEFDSVLRCPAPCFVPFESGSELAVVIDSGFSFTHVVPLLNGRIISEGVRRIDVGGKVLTNYMKELVSYRHLYMMDQTSAVEHMKEVACYVARDYRFELSLPQRTTMRTYVLPDFVPTSKNKLGYLLPPGVNKVESTNTDSASTTTEEELLHLDRERYQVPELLFDPSTIGMPQMGLAEALADSISSLPVDLQGLAWSNVICTGGTVSLPGFVERLTNEAQRFVPVDDGPSLSVSMSTDSIMAPVLAYPKAHEAFASDHSAWLSRQQYLEMGSAQATKRRQNKLYLSTSLLM